MQLFEQGVPSAHFYVMQDTGPLVVVARDAQACPLSARPWARPSVVAFAAVTVAVGETLTLADVAAVAAGADVTFPISARQRVATARSVVDDAVASGDVVYGVTTGFGALANVGSIPRRRPTSSTASSVRTRRRSGVRSRETKRERCSSSAPMSWRSVIPVFAPSSSI